MTRTNLNRMARGLAAAGVLAASGSAIGQITRAGAVGTVNPVPTAGAASRVPSGSFHRGFPTHFPGHHGRFVRDSRAFLHGGKIVIRSHVNVGVGTGLQYGSVHGIYPWPYGYYGSCGGYGTYGGTPLWEIDRRVYPDDGGLVVIVEAPPVDEGIEALREGRFVAARLTYLGRADERREAEESGEETGVDRSALRLAALASAGEGRYAEAERLFAQAYEEDASLWNDPLEGATLVGGSRAIREIVNGAVAHAHRVRSAEAWEMVGVLMQAEGRHDRARAMVERADEIRAGHAGVEGEGKMASGAGAEPE